MKKFRFLPMIAAALFAVATIPSCSEVLGEDPDDEQQEEQKPGSDTQEPAATDAVFQLVIDTENGAEILTKTDYVSCTVQIDGAGIYDDLDATAGIRGRGNSTWLWYDKKPYRFKLDSKQEVLGLGKAKKWVLLANYRDPTFLMNAIVFDMGHWCGMPHTNHNRFVELTLNGEYMGLYQLTEQVEEGSKRVVLDEKEGRLLSLDADDGPDLSPEEQDNFWSGVYNMPICIKFPEDDDMLAQKSSIESEFAALEHTIQSGKYAEIEKILDIQSMIDYMIIQELVDNVEMCAPRSVYMFRKDSKSKWTMGPLWDFDAGFDFDWGTMYTGHNYFADVNDLIFGSDPYNGRGLYGATPRFFLDLFGCKEFVAAYKARWNEIAYPMVDYIVGEQIPYYTKLLKDALKRNDRRWPIQPKYNTETSKLMNWLENRVDRLDPVINSYPDGK